MSSESYRLTDHAREEAERRGIPLDILDMVIRSPDQIIAAFGGRKAHQSKITFDDKLYLIRAIVEDSNPAVVVTVYRTSKIEKYWSDES